jgi:hypothetical protein
MPYFMEFSPAIGMHAGYLPGYPASHGCVRMPRDLAEQFFERVHSGTPVTVVGSTQNLSRVRKAIPILSSRPTVLSHHLSINRLILAPVSWISRSSQR